MDAMDTNYTERYINPLTDFGFKRIFGTPFNKALLIDFLNALLEGEREVSDVTYRNSEQLGTNIEERRAVFDVYCQAKDGSRFIVEMQNVYQEFYKDRSIYYSTFPIAEQSKRGDCIIQSCGFDILHLTCGHYSPPYTLSATPHNTV